MTKKLILSFDIPKERGSLRIRIWRELNKIGADNTFGSYWTLSDNKSNQVEFKKIKREIVKFGGKASVIIGEEVE
jgi:hypothetical protein